MKKFLKSFLGVALMTSGPAMVAFAAYAGSWILGIISVAVSATAGAVGLSIIEHEFEGEEK